MYLLSDICCFVTQKHLSLDTIAVLYGNLTFKFAEEEFVTDNLTFKITKEEDFVKKVLIIDSRIKINSFFNSC